MSPHLYDQTVDHGRTTMLVEPNVGSEAVCIDHVTRFDVPRNAQLTALIGDPRNDENLIVNQLHLAILRFHNRVVADVRGSSARWPHPQSCSPRRSGSSGGTTSG